MGAHTRLAEVSGKLLFPVRARFDCRLGTYGGVLRKACRSWPRAKSKTKPFGTGKPSHPAIRIFRGPGFITPAELTGEHTVGYQAAARALMTAYQQVSARVVDHLCETLPRPEEMKPEAYKRNIAARAFDVARYLLFFGECPPTSAR